ncbi:MAG: hypothetical protein A2583_00965 [Bdellovibrionales bacterium RIFOXYD1_FULL_53_11]|nr:MAG: hypothetical protein A2583_00965 [Bdellovibrionales bacterium RIFOXYD1_FULL_53_11]
MKMKNISSLARALPLAALCALATSCLKNVNVTGIPDTTPSTSSTPTATSSVDTSSCTTQVVDYGLKANTAQAQRGFFSDTRINPVNNYPAVAYFDTGTNGVPGGKAAIMLSYWNGTRWTQEVVAGEALVSNAAGSGQHLKLAFLSDGTPMVFWTSLITTAVRMAGRSVPLTSTTSATWTAGAIDVSPAAAPSAMEVAVNPLDQVGVHYMHTSTGTTMRGRFVYCLSNCKSNSNYYAMASSTDFIDSACSGAGTIAQVGVGMAWCKNSATQYYPVVTYYSGAADSGYYAACLNTPENCGTTGQWQKKAVSAAPTLTNADFSKVYIDSTQQGDRPKVIFRTTAAVTLSATELSTACNVSPVGATLSTVLVGNSAATTANAWGQLMGDSSGRYHFIANTSTTSVTYFNVVTPNSFGSVAWGNGATVETSTLPAANVGGVGGAALSSSNNAIYSSHATTAGNYNLTMGVINGLSTSSAASPVISTMYPDTTGGIQIPLIATYAFRNVSIAATAAGRPAVAYIDFSTGAITSGKLKYAYRNGTSSSDPWIVNLVPGAVSPQYVSMAFDSNNTPWIGYYEANVLGATYRYYLANNSRADGTGTWYTYMFPSYTKTAGAVHPLADEISVAMYYSGGVSYPVMIIASSGAAFTMRSAMLTPGLGFVSGTTLIDGIASGIQKLASDFDSNGNIVIAYYDVASTKVKYAHTSNGGGTWNGPVLASSTAAIGQGISIKLNSSGIPGIAYYGKTQNNVYYSQCSLASASACANVTGWATSTIVNASAGSLGVSGLVAATDQWMSTAISFLSDLAYVYYPIGAGSSLSQGLMVGIAGNTSGTTFTNSTLYSGANATTALSPNANVNNFALAGTQVSTIRNAATGKSQTAYIGPGNWLYVTSCGD